MSLKFNGFDVIIVPEGWRGGNSSIANALSIWSDGGTRG